MTRAADEQPRRPERLARRPGAHRADPRAETAADADQRKQPLALLLGVEVVRERPELRDDHHVEDADPEEVDDADAQARAEQRSHEEDELAAKNSVTHWISCMRLTREANAP